jgi:hypothetical protein
MFNAPWTREQEADRLIAFRDARNTNNKTSSMGFAPGIRGGEMGPFWR